MANDIDKTSPHYKGEFGSIYEVNQKFPSGGVEGDYVAIDGWAHYWNADRGTWCVNAQRDSYWDELITNIIEHFKTINGATYMGVATTDTVPDTTAAKMFYFALQGGKYANFGNQDVAQGINVLMTEDGKSWTVQSLISVAQELGTSTTMLVSQKAITDAINRKANTTDVDEALSKKADKETMNTELARKFDKENVAQELGDSEDKVVSQYALPFRIEESEEWAYLIKDAEGHVLFGIQQDGSVEWSAGIPAPIRKRFEEIVSSASDDKSDLSTKIDELNTSLSAEIQSLKDTKVDKEEGKSLIDDEVKNSFEVVESEEFLEVKKDAEEHILEAITADGKKQINLPLEVPETTINHAATISSEDNEEWLDLKVDREKHILEGISRDGKKYINLPLVNPTIQEMQERMRNNVLEIEFDDATGNINAILGDHSTITDITTDEDGNIIMTEDANVAVGKDTIATYASIDEQTETIKFNK